MPSMSSHNPPNATGNQRDHKLRHADANVSGAEAAHAETAEQELQQPGDHLPFV